MASDLSSSAAEGAFSAHHDDAVVMAVYRGVVRAARALSPLLSTGESKLARGIAGRRHAHEVLEAWGRGPRDPALPTVWFHAPSVGEALQAQAVMKALRAMVRQHLQVVFTFFSPSAEGAAREFGADAATYLPWDLPGPMGCVLAAVRPDLIVFSRTEVWPVLASEAGRQRIPTAITGACVGVGSSRARWPARALLRPTWSALAAVAAVSEADAVRLIGLGADPARVHVTGDPRVDSALERFEARGPGLQALRDEARPTVVAGSTWPVDEDVLIGALASLRTRLPGLRLFIAPHEPTPDRVARLAARLTASGWRVQPLSVVESGEGVADVSAIVVDRVGALASLYSVASVAYVGGGFAGKGSPGRVFCVLGERDRVEACIPYWSRRPPRCLSCSAPGTVTTNRRWA